MRTVKTKRVTVNLAGAKTTGVSAGKATGRGAVSGFMTGMLVLVMVLAVAGCGKKDSSVQNSSVQNSSVQDSSVQNSSNTQSASDDKLSIVGQGNTVFYFTVTDKETRETKFEVHTDKATVGEALQEVKLISGDESAYGLYVKTVNGITADYDTDKTYWAFYINGEYAMTGVDATAVEAGKTYSFKIEK